MPDLKYKGRYKEYNKIYSKIYREIHKEQIKKYNDKWRKDNKDYNKDYMKTWRKLENGKKSQRKAHKKYEENNLEKTREQCRKYRKTEKGKLIFQKHSSDRRNLGRNLIMENIIDEPIEYHHINDEDVIAIPCDLHNLYPGGNREEHRFMCNHIAEQLYNIKIEENE